MDKNGARQQLVEKIKSSSNILVTVGTNPTVDELAAALGTTLVLNSLEKHATAVVSGKIPPAITFLDPSKTFESTVDSLRDFIIALDKEKADHLRYKIDGDVVKIFITPYRTTISEKDLDFSQGDYNVELVIAIGVASKEHLDKALSAHGRILHDATVATVTAGDATSTLGSIDWHDDRASSVSEMLVNMIESLKGDDPLLTEQTATAFLTGIVSATERFSNPKTSSKVMTIAAQLMAAGANQQLIASKLAASESVSDASQQPVKEEASSDIASSSDTQTEATKIETPPKDPGYLKLEHEEPESTPVDTAGTVAEAIETDQADQVKNDVVTNNQAKAAKEAEEALAKELEAVKASAPVSTEPPVLKGAVDASVWKTTSNENTDEPSLGGTLNATTAQAENDSEKAIEDDRNKVILSHGPLLSTEQTYDQSVNDAPTEPSQPSVEEIQATETPHEQTLAEIDAANRAAASIESHEADAREQVSAALNDASFNPSFNPQENMGAQELPPVDQSQLSASQMPTSNMPLPPPLPDFSTLPPLPSTPIQQAPVSDAQQPPFIDPTVQPNQSNQPTSSVANDPGQFRIPGQN